MENMYELRYGNFVTELRRSSEFNRTIYKSQGDEKFNIPTFIIFHFNFSFFFLAEHNLDYSTSKFQRFPYHYVLSIRVEKDRNMC